MDNGTVENPLNRVLDANEILPRPMYSAWTIESVRSWWDGKLNLFRARSAGQEPFEIWGFESKREALPFIPLSDGRRVVNDPPDMFRLNPGTMDLQIVVRQWVEEASESHKFALELEKIRMWQLEIESLRNVKGQQPLPDELLAQYLSTSGLPHNPSVIAYAKARVRNSTPEQCPIPLRGGLVTTYLFGTCAIIGDIYHEIALNHAWSKPGLWTLARETARDHARWMKRLPIASVPQIDLRAYNRKAPPEPDYRKDIEDHLNGLISSNEFFNRTIKREEELVGRVLTKNEIVKVQQRCQKAIYRAKTSRT